MTSEDDWVADDIYSINTTVDGNCWGVKDVDSINSSRVSSKVGS